jgi:FkbM family methyltransferase
MAQRDYCSLLVTRILSGPGAEPFSFSFTPRGGGCSVTLELSTQNDFSAFYQAAIEETYRGLRLAPGEVVLDAGANIGVYTIIAARSVGPNGVVISVEPDERNYSRLLRNIHLNQLGNVIPIRAAVWDKSGRTVALTGGGTMVRAEESELLTGRIARTVSPDDLLSHAGVEHLTKVKMDIEGGELRVFGSNACSPLLEAKRIAVEVHSDTASRAVRGRLEGAGFTELPRSRADREPWIVARTLAHYPMVSLRLEMTNHLRSLRQLVARLASPTGAEGFKATVLSFGHS